MSVTITKGGKRSVWVVRFWYKYEDYVIVCETERAAERTVREIVESSWADRSDINAPDEFPADWDYDALVEAYFDEHPNECFSIEQKELVR